MYEDIISWFKVAIPNATVDSQRQKVLSEIQELIDAIEIFNENKTDENRRNCWLELIDVVISSINLSSFPEVQDLIKYKMELNRKRIWDGDQHKE